MPDTKTYRTCNKNGGWSKPDTEVILIKQHEPKNTYPKQICIQSILENARIRNRTPLTQDSLHSFSDSTLPPKKDPPRIASIPTQKLMTSTGRGCTILIPSAKPLASESIDRATARYSASFRESSLLLSASALVSSRCPEQTIFHCIQSSAFSVYRYRETT